MWGLIFLMVAVGFAAALVVTTIVLTFLLDCWHYVLPFKYYSPQYIYRRPPPDLLD